MLGRGASPARHAGGAGHRPRLRRGTRSIELAEAGFDVTGIDFSPVALRKARAAAATRGLDADRLRFLEGDLTLGHVPGVEGPYDLLVDYGTLDDLPADGRRSMAGVRGATGAAGLEAVPVRLLRPPVRPPPDELRRSFEGVSGLMPGEVERLFEPAFRVEAIDPPTRTRHWGTWLLERTGAVDA